MKKPLKLPEYHKNFKQYIQKEGDGALTAKVEGILGEMAAEHWLKYHGFNYLDCRDQITHDYLIENTITLEVKSKRRSVPPRPNYEATDPLYVHNVQKPTAYLFISHQLKKGRDDDYECYIESNVVGGLSRKKFDIAKRTVVQGQHDTTNDWNCSEACYNVYISDLFSHDVYANKLKQFLAKNTEKT